MVTEKRIEELLNYFGETISDLPKSSDNDYSGVVYESKDLINAKKRALAFIMDEWNDAVTVPEIVYQIEEVLLDYICHQSDAIEKLVSALEKATKLTSDRNLEDTDAVRVQQENIQEKV